MWNLLNELLIGDLHFLRLEGKKVINVFCVFL